MHLKTSEWVASFRYCLGILTAARMTSTLSQPRSQGLSSSLPLERERRDPGWVWSRVSQKKIIPREGSFVVRFFWHIIFVKFKSSPNSIRSLRKSTAMFLSCLQFAICKSSYSNVNLKVKQVKCLEAIYFGRDVVAVLPTGYGKSLIFQLLSPLLHARITSTCNIVQTTLLSRSRGREEERPWERG